MRQWYLHEYWKARKHSQPIGMKKSNWWNEDDSIFMEAYSLFEYNKVMMKLEILVGLMNEIKVRWIICR